MDYFSFESSPREIRGSDCGAMRDDIGVAVDDTGPQVGDLEGLESLRRGLYFQTLDFRWVIRLFILFFSSGFVN